MLWRVIRSYEMFYLFGIGRNNLVNELIRSSIKAILPIIDIVVTPFVYPAALLLWAIRRVGIARMPRCKRALLQVGVFPIRNHYFEPLFDERHFVQSFKEDRMLPGLDLNVSQQLKLLDSLCFNEELREFPRTKTDDMTFFINNGNFEEGDAEYFYSVIRQRKPARIFEIGSGFSTLVALKAVQKNKEDDNSYECDHLCIEPYSNAWLEESGVRVIRKKVENIDKRVFSELIEGDILFIDSSHIIRCQGDVLFEYLELLPSLNNGVIIHIHDIFTPRDYPRRWVVDDVRFWNEQYLLEAFLTFNSNFKVIAALNYLQHNHFENLQAKCPFLTSNSEPGSFYIEKVGPATA